MRQITRLQITALWLCLAYFVVAFLVVGSRAAWGFLGLASQYRDALVPREILLGIANSAAQDFRLHALLLGVGSALLAAVLVRITKSRRV